MNAGVPLVPLHWKPSWRVIPTRYPEINLWKRVALPKDEAAVDEIERLTNNRVRQESGEIHVLRLGDFFKEKCPQDVVATFSYRGVGSRFSTITFAAYYTAKSLPTAVYEKAHRTIKLLTEARIPATKVDMRVNSRGNSRQGMRRAREAKIPAAPLPSDGLQCFATMGDTGVESRRARHRLRQRPPSQWPMRRHL